MELRGGRERKKVERESDWGKERKMYYMGFVTQSQMERKREREKKRDKERENRRQKERQRQSKDSKKERKQ